MAAIGKPDAIVVGAGFAGLSAAVRLTLSGLKVLVLEARSRLGGRATAVKDSATGELVDNGQHVLAGCYGATFEFLHEIGATENVRLQPQLSVSMIDRAGSRSRLVCPSLPAPWHILAGVLEWEALDWNDRLSVLRIAAPLKLARRQAQFEFEQQRSRAGDPGRSARGVRVIAASPGETAEDWLVRHGQTERVREMLWRALALAALNQPADRAAAPVFARVLAEMFGGNPQAAAIALPVKPLHLMYAEPARLFIESHGGEVRTEAAAKVHLCPDGVVGVAAGGSFWKPQAVVSAVPWFALTSLFDRLPEALSGVVDRAGRMAALPIATVNLWFDRPILDEPFVGLPGRTMQWAFDTHRIRGGGFLVAVVSSGAEPIVGLPNDRLISIAYEELLEALPATRSAKLLRSTVVRERQATFSLAPGQPARPPTNTRVRGLYLAGDWIDTGLPATIEGAVRSGHWAAKAVLTQLSGRLVI